MLSTIKHLLPKARAWSLTPTSNLRSMFVGLAESWSVIKNNLSIVWSDTMPTTTRELDKWENQFGYAAPGQPVSVRRDLLTASWRAVGGQSPRYIQDTLQAAGFAVWVHEWWSDTVPTARNPFDYLRGNTGVIIYTWECGEPGAECGEPGVECGETTENPGYALVNLQYITRSFGVIDCGELGGECGESSMQCGNFDEIYFVRRVYDLPNDAATFPCYVYICGENFPDPANVPSSRRLELERLLLKIFPSHLWIGVLVNYN